MSRTTTRSRLAVALILIALLTACAEDSSPPPAPTPVNHTSAPNLPSRSPAPSERPVTGEDAQRQALETYLGMQAAFAQAGRDGAPNDPDLNKYATGAAFDLLTTALRSRTKQGILARGETVHHAKVTEMSPIDSPTRASVRDCMDTRKSSLYKPNGTPVPQDKGGFRLALSDLELIEGAWKVTTLAVRETGTCKP